MSVALVPVKSLARAKSRLLPELERHELERLSLAMLGDVLEALRATPSIREVAVVTPDPAVAKATEDAGGRALLRDDPGLNASLDAAAQQLRLEGEGLLVVLGDVAAALPDDLESIFAAAAELGSPCAVLAPSQDGGSSALLRVPHDALPSRFGPESAQAHRDAAHEAGVPFREVRAPSLALDLDRPSDLEQFMKTRSGGSRTRALLRELAWQDKSKEKRV